MAHNIEELDRHVRACIVVFVCLLGLTAVTVLASYLKLPSAATITIALCIAMVKASLVILYFMHLISERKLIYYALTVTLGFFLLLLLLPYAGNSDIIRQLIWRQV